MNVRTLDEVGPFERLALIDMSYSRLDTYIQCPAKYFFTYIQKEPRTFGPAAALGNIIHGVLELAEPDLRLADLLMLMEEQRAKYDPAREIEPKLIQAGYQMLIDHIDRSVGSKPEVLGRETEFNIVVGSALVLGFIDLILRRADGHVQVVDYKSGAWEIKERPAENLQLGLYALAASRMWEGGADGIYAELYYLRTGHRKGHLFTAADLEAVATRLEELVNTVVEDRAFHHTDNAFLCQRMCDFGKSGACPVGKARVGRY